MFRPFQTLIWANFEKKAGLPDSSSWAGTATNGNLMQILILSDAKVRKNLSKEIKNT